MAHFLKVLSKPCLSCIHHVVDFHKIVEIEKYFVPISLPGQDGNTMLFFNKIMLPTWQVHLKWPILVGSLNEDYFLDFLQKSFITFTA